MSALWSPEQQAWLKALGHRVLALASEEPSWGAPALDPAHDVRAPVAALPGQRRAHDAGAHEAAVPRPERPRPTALPDVRAPSPARPPAAGSASPPTPSASLSRAPDDALERALLRVTGQRTRSEARALLERLGVDVAALRGDPAAKRRLWRVLRPLRPRFRP